MRGTSKSVPKYRKHKKSGQAVCTLNSKDHYLGPHGTKVSLAEYDRVIAEWLASGRKIIAPDQDEQTIVEVIAAFLKHAKQYYRRDGEQTGSYNNYVIALKELKRLYGRTVANEFCPLGLEAIRTVLIGQGLARTTVNDRIALIKKCFKWAVSKKLVKAEVHHSLVTLAGLAMGRSEARECQPIKPVEDDQVDATLGHLPEVVADMVRLQRLTGARPAEICIMRPMDIDRDGEVWIYKPRYHKTQHHGHDRLIAIGPKGQEILKKYLDRDELIHLFSPKESEAKRRKRLHEMRVTPLSCGNKPGSNRKRKPMVSLNDVYTVSSYRRVIHRGCEKAKLKKWSPNQLRHSAATKLRKQFGIEVARIQLGHHRLATTEIYAEKDLNEVMKVALQIG